MHVYSRIISIISEANTSGDNKEESSQSKANKQTKTFAGKIEQSKAQTITDWNEEEQAKISQKKTRKIEKNGMQTRRVTMMVPKLR